MICHYFYFLIDEIWLDRQDNILLGVILFFVLAKHSLICSIWTFQFIQDHPLGLAVGPSFWDGTEGPGYCIGYAIPLGLASGMVSPFF